MIVKFNQIKNGEIFRYKNVGDYDFRNKKYLMIDRKLKKAGQCVCIYEDGHKSNRETAFMGWRLDQLICDVLNRPDDDMALDFL